MIDTFQIMFIIDDGFVDFRIRLGASVECRVGSGPWVSDISRDARELANYFFHCL